jgi:uncharacterized membrane protein YczE
MNAPTLGPPSKPAPRSLGPTASGAPQLAQTAAQSFQFVIRIFVVTCGISGVALGILGVVRARLGSDPLTACIQGLALTLGWTLGQATQSLFLLLLLIVVVWDRKRLGVATLLSVLLEGPLLDLFDGLLRWAPDGLVARASGLLVSICLMGLSIALYVSPQLGTGPPEGLMFVLHRRLSLRLGHAKLLMDSVCVLAGWLLGGNVGVGTVLAAVLLGPIVDILLPRMSVAPTRRVVPSV